MKLKNLSDLGNIYENIASDTNENLKKNPAKPVQHVLLTDATQYLPEAKSKTGDALGGGPGAKDGESKLAAKTGPQGLKGNDFKKIEEDQDPGASKKEMKSAADCDDETSDEDKKKNIFQKNKHTTAKEKVKESVGETAKYNFNMSKPKFDQLYEDAIKRIPFVENDETLNGDEGGLPPATDASADADAGGQAPEVGPEEVEVTAGEALECLKKVMSYLEKQVGGDLGDGSEIEGDTGDSAAGDGSGLGVPGESANPVTEEVEAEDEGTPLVNQKKGKPESGKDSNKVSDLKKTSGTADKGTFKSEPTPKEQGEFSKDLTNVKGDRKVGTGTVVTTGKKLFEQRS